ncbi:Hsp20 family protein [Botryobacter ruber]|uniref:Hsp20 family protein n=1 Tax=Botryobacter ruber TaxID=2171629 RepID=UPI000E0AF85E|nr:Hsp20/alpha crystallin family protein [Botryobacter ruber]
MKLIKDKEFLRNIAQHIDLLNTVGGGISETYVEVKKYRKGAVIQVKAAGVIPEAFKVLLHNNQLSIMSVLQNQEKSGVGVPLFAQTFVLPPEVDVTGIEAVHQESALQIRLPYHDAANNPKEIEIKTL